ncbi:MAG: mammalian cell entry protein [Mycobacteriaceae bacterium]|nr:mammalian cell entry protein [Mycobacteriaceae bacterium]
MTADAPKSRRRAVRAAGPAKGTAPEPTTVRVDKPTEEAPRTRKSGPPPRRQPNRRLVAVVALSCVGAATFGLAAAGYFLLWRPKVEWEQTQAHNQRYVDTASQTLVNMYTFKPDNVEQSVDQFYRGISGQLRDEWARDNHIANLKAFLRATGNSSEAVVNGAALESVDNETKTASVLVSLRVTQSDSNGNNKPSLPMRWRVVVQENLDTGQMTTSDMRYPDGGS